MSQQTRPSIPNTARPKVALVGPTLPYRGGIAHYTTELQHALEQQAELQTISFKRQYPMWLYPGKTDKGFETEAGGEPGVNYLLDIYNPFTWRQAADQIARNGCDLAVFDWWTLIWQPGFAYMARRLRHHGVKTAFLCHNLFDHDAQGAKRKLSELFLKQADAYIVQSSEQIAQLRGIKPQAELLFHIHPINSSLSAQGKRLGKRGRLELLFFGFIRPYKGLDILLDSLSSLHDEGLFVTIVGEVWGDVEALRKRIDDAGIPNLETQLAYVSNEAAADYFERADAVVLPYRSATGSGVVALAYNYGKPVIASAVGGLKDAVVDGQTGWLVTPEDLLELAKAIQNLSRTQAEAMRPAIEDFCQKNSWESLATAICQLAGKH